MKQERGGKGARDEWRRKTGAWKRGSKRPGKDGLGDRRMEKREEYYFVVSAKFILSFLNIIVLFSST